MKIRAYTIAHHTNFAPHVRNGLLSLANCKPQIREYAKVGEWIVGIAPKSMGCGVVYVMKVTAKVDRRQYWEKYGSVRMPKRNDAIYKPAANNSWSLVKNPWHGENDIKHDTRINDILLSKEFYILSDCYHSENFVNPPCYPQLAFAGIRGAGKWVNVEPAFINWVGRQKQFKLENEPTRNSSQKCSCSQGRHKRTC